MNIDKLKQVIQKANPSILELKFGCEILSIRGKKIVVSNENIEIIKSFETEIEILGRQITFTDVLITLGKKVSRDILCELYILWYLKDNNLDNQPDKCKQFLIDLLVTK